MAIKKAAPSEAKQRSKEVSVTAWIEDAFGKVLLVKQTAAKRLWSLPGGKVNTKESLQAALEREVYAKTGVLIEKLKFAGIYDRPEKGALRVLFRARLKSGRLTRRPKEIEAIEFRTSLPRRVTPSAKFFWKKMFSE